ncbi:MAG: YceI family protein [Anaerolineae bacterium]|nr:YceI family protein [Anaerolineae bacterium]
MVKLLALLIAACFLLGCTARPTATPQPTLTPTIPATPIPKQPLYQIDTQASIVDYLGTGAFNIQFPGTFSLKGNQIALVPEGDGYRVKVDVVMDGNSVTAVNDLVKGALYNNLEVPKYPTARVLLDSVELIKLDDSGGEIKFTGSGTIDLHGVVRNISIPLTMTIKDGTLHATGETKLDLLDHNVNVPTAIMSSTITFKANITALEVTDRAVAATTATP